MNIHTHMGGIDMNLENIVLLKTFAERHNLDYKKLRRMARKNEFDAPFKFGNTWFINADVPAPIIPERKSRTRSDGRTRFVVYVDRGNDDLRARGMDELQRVRDIVGHDNVIDLRDVRLARKLANAAAADATITAVFGDAPDGDADTVLHGVPMRELPDGTLVVDGDTA